MSATPEPETADAAADKAAGEERIAKARARRAAAGDDEEVTKLPRGKGVRVTRGQLVKIGLTAAVLVMLLVVQRPCSEAVSSFVTSFGDDKGSASNKMPKPGTVEPAREQHYEVLSPDMTDAELKAAIERAKRNAGSGSETTKGAPESAPSGSAGSAR